MLFLGDFLCHFRGWGEGRLGVGGILINFVDLND